MNRSLLALILLAGCGGDADKDDSASPTTTPGDTDDTDDTDGAPIDTDTRPLALAGRSGEATADGVAFDGWEERFLVADAGTGVELCRVRTALASSGVVADCAVCDWAHRLTVSEAAVVTEVDGACTRWLGIADVAELDGSTQAYGYVAEYMGHAEVLLQEEGGAWVAVAFADWDADTGALSWTRDDGFVPVP